MSFNNTGRQLKTWAVVFRWLCIVVGLILTIYGVVQATSGRYGQEAASVKTLTWGLSLMVVGWVGSLALYGFGIIVAAHESKADDVVKPAVQPAAPNTPSAPGWKCRCGTENPQHVSTCSQCGESKPQRISASAGSSEASATAGWRCRHCGTENSKYVGNCLKCGEPKPLA